MPTKRKPAGHGKKSKSSSGTRLQKLSDKPANAPIADVDSEPKYHRIEVQLPRLTCQCGERLMGIESAVLDPEKKIWHTKPYPMRCGWGFQPAWMMETPPKKPWWKRLWDWGKQ